MRELARAQVVLGVALRPAGIVVVRAFIGGPAEELVVALGAVGAHQALERFKLPAVTLVLAHLAKRERFSLSLAQNTHQHVGRIHRPQRLEEVASLVGAGIGLHFLVVGERELAALRLGEEHVRELGRISHHSAGNRLGQLLVRLLHAERGFHPLALLGRPQRRVDQRLLQRRRITCAVDVMRLAPFLECPAQLIDRIPHVCVLRAERGVVLEQEIAAMLHDVVECQVDEPDIGLLVGLYQVRA